MDYKKDYYSILAVDEKASPEALRDSYRRLAKLHHPDKNPGNPDAEERFKTINEAFEILSNEITRHLYDSYRTSNRKDYESQTNNENSNSHNAYKPNATTKKRTYTVKREKRIYVHGSIEVKFQGEPELADTYTRQWEQRFTIIPTEVLATITSSAIYKNAPPKEYQMSYSSAEIFATPLQQPVNCRIITGEQEEYYLLDLYDIRIEDPTIKDITRHDQYSFGTLEGTLLAYILVEYIEEVTEEHTEYAGQTGLVETKSVSGYTYTREQWYAADGSTYWAEWKRSPGYSGRYQSHNGTGRTIIKNKKDRWSDLSWLIVLLLLIAIWPKLLFYIIPMIVFFILLAISGWVISAFTKGLPWLGRIAITLIIFFAIRSLFHQSGSGAKRVVSNRGIDSIRSEKEIIRQQNHQPDTIIRHTMVWEDRDSAQYTLQLSISASALRQSSIAHHQMDYQQYGSRGISAVYRSMLETDRDHLNPTVNAFDSLASIRSLDNTHRASMIVSCIQSIPYSLIVDGSCSANYSDDFVRQFLLTCESDCCKGYSKFGVQSPVEFLGDLKGDCDTRALLLYDILGKLGYKVALMTSDYYKHAVIAIHLNEVSTEKAAFIKINGVPYYLWETTSKGFGPGELPPAFSNLNYWNIALIQ